MAATRFALGVVIGLLLWLGALHGTRSPYPPPPPVPLDDEALSGADFAGLSAWAGVATAQDLDAALRRLDPFQLMRREIRVESGAAELWSTGGERLARVPLRQGGEVVAASSPPVIDRAAPLAGLRILLDPGHFGGSWSEMEHRHLVVNEGPVLREGHINWGTALLVRDQLRAAGAEVILTRRSPPTRPWREPPAEALASASELGNWLSRTYPDRMTTAWLLEHPAQLEQLWASGLSARLNPERSFFDEYNRFDFRRRSRMTETVRPHLTLSLHHNMAGQAELNRVVVFVPGMVLAPENDAATRFYVFRRALAGGDGFLERLALDFSKALQRELRLPAAQRPGEHDHPRKLPIFPEDGVFARNLALLRRAVGPVLLLEGPCMNVPGEYERLTAQDFELEGAWYPNRIRPYADAVVGVIMENRKHLLAGRGRD